MVLLRVLAREESLQHCDDSLKHQTLVWHEMSTRQLVCHSVKLVSFITFVKLYLVSVYLGRGFMGV